MMAGDPESNNSPENERSSDIDQDSTPPSCPLCSCGRKSWAIWLIILVFIVVFIYVNRSASAPVSFTWVESLEEGMAQAKKTNRPIFIKFYATWCGPCKMMDRDVFSQPEVGQALANWIPVKIDVEHDVELALRFGVHNLPSFVILNPQGRKLEMRIGAMSVQDCLQLLQSTEKEMAAESTRPSI